MNTEYYLKRCYDLAITSNDPSTQNGALVVNNSLIVGESCNRFPDRVEETYQRWHDRKTKLAIVIHAESGACIRAGTAANGGTLYACWAACTECMKDIIAYGIKRLVAHDIPEHRERDEWVENIKFADEIMKEAGVEVIRVAMRLNKTIRFAGRIINV